MTEDPLTEEEMAKIGTLERGNRLVKGQVFLWEGAKDWHCLLYTSRTERTGYDSDNTIYC